MRFFLFALIPAAAALLAADKDLNGRWDIKVLNEPRARVWWLEVEGAGMPAVKGSFVGAPGGGVDVIPMVEPTFSIRGSKYRVLARGNETFPPMSNVLGLTTPKAASR